MEIKLQKKVKTAIALLLTFNVNYFMLLTKSSKNTDILKKSQFPFIRLKVHTSKSIQMHVHNLLNSLCANGAVGHR